MHTFAGKITIRRARNDDQAFLFLLYRVGRATEMAEWGWSSVEQELFLRFQFDAQQRHYAAVLPRAQRLIVLEEEDTVGSLLVVPGGEHPEADGGEPVHLADIALLPEKRGRGIGTFLVQELKEEAQQNRHDITLFVRRDNEVAMRLYERLGFRHVDEGEVSDTNFQDLQMRWRHRREYEDLHTLPDQPDQKQR